MLGLSVSPAWQILHQWSANPTRRDFATEMTCASFTGMVYWMSKRS